MIIVREIGTREIFHLEEREILAVRPHPRNPTLAVIRLVDLTYRIVATSTGRIRRQLRQAQRERLR